MREPVAVSALIVTYRRREWLARCVSSLVSAAGAAGITLEIGIVVNGPDPESWLEAQRLRERFPEAAIRTSRLDTAETPAEARNGALSGLSHEWVLFIDDDAFVEADFFSRFIEATRARPRASAIGGPNLTPPGSSAFQVAVGCALGSRFGSFGSFTRYKPTGGIRTASERDLILCNLFVGRAALSSIGSRPFPRDLECAEENWLIQDLVARGFEVVHDPALRVSHERRATLAELARQVLKYGYGRGQNIFRRPASARLLHLIPSAANLAAIALLLLSIRDGAIHPAAWLLLGTYASLTAGATLLESRDPRIAALQAPLFPLIHVSYGFGVIAGISGELYEAVLRLASKPPARKPDPRHESRLG